MVYRLVEDGQVTCRTIVKFMGLDEMEWKVWQYLSFLFSLSYYLQSLNFDLYENYDNAVYTRCHIVMSVWSSAGLFGAILYKYF